MLYLPLDKMLEGRNTTPQNTTSTTGSNSSPVDTTVRISSEPLTRDLRARGSR